MGSPITNFRCLFFEQLVENSNPQLYISSNHNLSGNTFSMAETIDKHEYNIKFVFEKLGILQLDVLNSLFTKPLTP